MNAEQGTSYDVKKFVEWTFNGESNARPGWGVLTGQFEKAFHYNACIYLWIPIGVYFFWKRYVKCSEQCNKQCSKRCCMWMPQLLAAAGVIMIIYYLYRMMFLFPGEEPLIFFSDNMLGRVIPVYNEIIEKRWNLGVTDISVL